jgi:4-hydroxy-tetrahydrodipicolinate synthase
MPTNKVIRGIVPPLITPRTPDGAVDRDSLRRLIEFQVEAGVDGLWILGSCGEFHLLTDSQRQEVMEVAVEAADRHVPVFVGAVETGTDRSIRWARAAEAAGADGFFVTTPIYLPVSQDEILTHCRKVRSAVDLPLVLYNAQFATQTRIDNTTICALAEDRTLAAVKDTSGNWTDFRELVVELCGLDGFSILTGNEVMMDVALLMGADGCIASTANVVPELYVELFKAAREGNWSEAARLQNKATAINHLVKSGDSRASGSSMFFSGTKTALKLRGVIQYAVTGDPMTPATSEEERAIRNLLDRHGIGLWHRADSWGDGRTAP